MLNHKKVLLIAFFLLISFFGAERSGFPKELSQEYYEKGFAELQAKNFDKALEYFYKVLELHPTLPQIHNMIGMTHLQMQNSVHDAIAAFEEAIRLDPNYPEPHNQLGVIYATVVSDFELAEEYFKNSLAIDPNFSRSLFGLGWLYLAKKNDYDAAKKYLEKATVLDPNMIDAKYYLGFVYIMLNEKHRAIKPISELRALGARDYANSLQELMISSEGRIEDLPAL